LSNSERYQKQEVFWAPDPFKQNDNPRPWLVIAEETLPYPGEEYICLSLTRSNLPENHRVGDSWISGRNPDVESFCSPWVIATIKQDDIEAPQGKVAEEFTSRMVEECRKYL
jgi:hypothetical protein